MKRSILAGVTGVLVAASLPIASAEGNACEPPNMGFDVKAPDDLGRLACMLHHPDGDVTPPCLEPQCLGLPPVPDLPEVSPEDSYPVLGTCNGGTALAVTPLHIGNGGSWFQLYQDPIWNRVFASWSLMTNNINSGADHWAWGYQVSSGGWPNERASGVIARQAGYCELLIDFDDSLHQFHYTIDAGAGGASDSRVTFDQWNWAVGAKVEWSIKGPSGSITGELGHGWGTSEGMMWDTESLNRISAWTD